MANGDIPHPLPASVRDRVNTEVMTGPLAALDSEGRFALRRLVADTFAAGFHEGHVTEMINASVDNRSTVKDS